MTFSSFPFQEHNLKLCVQKKKSLESFPLRHILVSLNALHTDGSTGCCRPCNCKHKQQLTATCSNCSHVRMGVLQPSHYHMSKTSQGSNCQGTEQPFPPEEEEAEPKWEIPRWVINPGTPAGNRTKQQLN